MTTTTPQRTLARMYKGVPRGTTVRLVQRFAGYANYEWRSGRAGDGANPYVRPDELGMLFSVPYRIEHRVFAD